MLYPASFSFTDEDGGVQIVAYRFESDGCHISMTSPTSSIDVEDGKLKTTTKKNFTLAQIKRFRDALTEMIDEAETSHVKTCSRCQSDMMYIRDDMTDQGGPPEYSHFCLACKITE